MEAQGRSSRYEVVRNFLMVCFLTTVCKSSVDAQGEYDLVLAANLDPPGIFVAHPDSFNFTSIPACDADCQVLRPVAIDYDPVDAMVYWTDVQHSSISRAFLDGTGLVVVLTNLQAPDGLTLDVANRVMYWTDTGSELIEKATLDGKARSVVLNLTSVLGTVEPRAIILDPTNGHLYWTDWGSSPKIERANTNGGDRRVLISTDLQWPNGLAIDIPGDQLYWCDAGLDRIESTNLLGQNRRVIANLISVGIHPFDIALYQDSLFWTDWRFTTVLRVTLSPTPEASTFGSPTFLKGGGIHIHLDTFIDHSCMDSNPCGEGERCRQFLAHHECVCQDGPAGTNCTLPNPCAAFPCRNGGNCLQSTTNDGGFLCQCPNRYSGDICEVFDDPCNSHPCMNGGTCAGSSQGFSCTCPFEFLGTTCDIMKRPYDLAFVANLVPPGIFVAPTDTFNFTLIPGFDNHSDIRRPVAIDYDPIDGRVYWTDVALFTINRAFLDGTGLEILVDVQIADGLALDPENRVMYWTDSGTNLIERATLNGQDRYVIHNLTNASRSDIQPRAIVLDPQNSYLYWTDWGSNPRIERSRIDGSDRTMLVNTDLQYPNGLVLDLQGGRLFWCDAFYDRVEFTDLLGQGRTIVADLTSYDVHPYDIAYHYGFIYWTDWSTRSLIRADVPPTTVSNYGSSSFQRAGGLHIYQDKGTDHTCRDSSPCLNGGFCRQFLSSYECSCMNGFSGVNCQIASQPPQFVGGCPDDITTQSDAQTASVPVSWSEPEVTGGTNPLVLMSSHLPGHMFTVGVSTVVTYIVTDNLGKSTSCNFTVTVSGVGLDCPGSLTSFTSPGSATATVSWTLPHVVFTGTPLNVMFYVGQPSTPSSSDANGQVLVYSEYQSSGDIFGLGVTPVVYRVQGLSTVCRFNVRVVDNEPPVISNCPNDVNLPVLLPSDHTSHNWVPPIISDNVGSPNVAFKCSPPASSLECNQGGSGTFAAGVIKISYNATDLFDNWNTCSFTVTVKVVSIKCPADQVNLAEPGFTNATVSWPEPKLIGWSGPTNFTSTSLPDAVFSIGRHMISYTQWFGVLRLNCSFFVEVVGQCERTSTSDQLTWKATVAGSTAGSVMVCRLTTENAGHPLAVRNCSVVDAPVYFQWEEPESRSCGSDTADLNLDKVTEVPVSEGNAAEVAGFLANKTSESADDAGNVEAVSEILDNIVGAGSGDEKVTNLVVQTVNNILNVETNENLSPNARSSSSIVQSVETQVSLTLQQGGQVSIQQDNVQVRAVNVDADRARNGLTFASVPQPSSQPGEGATGEGTLAGTEVKTFTDASEIPEDRVASVVLPTNILSLLESANGNTSTMLQASFIVYADDTLFQSSLINQSRELNGSGLRVVGSVVSLTVENVKLVNLSEPVVIEFRAPSRTIPKDNITTIECVFWDFELNDNVGDWSKTGCTLAGNTSAIVSCHCSHATNFAILVDVKGQKTPSAIGRALDVISQIGVALSIIALVITLLIYLSFKKLRTGKSRQIFIHFCASLLMLYIVFIAGIDSAKGSGGGCVFVATLLHYLTLTSMLWMAVEARNMYVSTVKVFPEDDTRYMLKACLVAWGSPLVLVIITLAAATDHYENEHYCFLEPDLVLYLALLVPIGLILIHNIVTFILVMRSLLKVKEVSRSEQISKRLQNAVGISALMGLTWVFGFLAINEAAVAFQVFFCLANSMQGVLVFIMFCARREEVRTAVAPYMERICCGRLSIRRRDQQHNLLAISQSAPTSPTSLQTDHFDLSASEL